eukprot:1161341-Pelagomonas_calceolata.AAC.14
MQGLKQGHPRPHAGQVPPPLQTLSPPFSQQHSLPQGLVRWGLQTLLDARVIKLLTLGEDLQSFNFAAAARIHKYVPIGSREDMKLRALIIKVSTIELFSLCDGINEGEDPDLVLSKEDATEEEENDVGAWMSDDEEEVEVDDGMDCFGVSMQNEGDSMMDAGVDKEDAAAAELDNLQR